VGSGKHRKSKKVKPKKKRSSWKRDKNAGVQYQFMPPDEWMLADPNMQP